jgi:hypothetical protein
MKKRLLKFVLIFISFFCISTYLLKGQDTLSYSINFNYLKDLSDTFGGGTLVSGEFVLSKSWYGADICYGHFQSYSHINYEIVIEEDNQSFSIPFDELSIMQTGSLSSLITPIRHHWFQFDAIFGLVCSRSKSSCFKSLSYTYNFNEKKLMSVEKDYQLIERTHFGYQVGANVSFYFLKKAGLQLNARIQDLSNGGTFFFVGGGLCFRI